MSNKYIYTLHEVGKESIPLVGGKGANLGELISNQFPVPNGFCISVDAYKEQISLNNLEDKIKIILSKTNWESPANIEEQSMKIRDLFIEQDILQEIEEEIARAHSVLQKDSKNDVYVAVRSSATAEDLPDASFAGQQETYLYVKGKEDLLHYVKSCWASIWSARAMAYRHKLNYQHHKIYLAVVVQEMVDAEVSGISFTRNPISQIETEMLVTSSYGLGELVVSGQVTPDSFIIDKKNLSMTRKELGTKEKQLIMSLNGRTKLEEIPMNKRQKYSLSENQLQELGQLAIRVENHYGYPQDIEWAFANNQLYLLQARPITTLKMAEENQLKSLSKTQIRILDDLLEHYPEAPTPLDYSVVTMSYQALLNRGEHLGISLSKAKEIIRINHEGRIKLYPPKIEVRGRIISLPFKLIKAAKVNEQSWYQIEGEFKATIENVKRLDLKNLSNQQLLKEFNHLFNLAERVNHLRFTFIVDSTMIPLSLLSIIIKIFISKKKQPALSDIITTNLKYKTSIIDKELLELAIQISQNPEIKTLILKGNFDHIDAFYTRLLALPKGSQIWGELQSFLSLYGYRTEKMYQPFISKSWIDDQIYFLDILRAVLNDPKLYERKQMLEERNNKHQLWLENFTNTLKGPIKRTFKRNYERLRKIYIYREETVFFTETIFHFGRRIINELAIRLNEKGILENTRDIIYFQREELTSLIENSDATEHLQIIKKRKESMKINHLSWKENIIRLLKKSDKDTNIINGTSGSNGVAEGPVKIINKVEDFNKLEQGDILVCQYTDPTWTPLFGIAAAVVADTGGPLSHAAIVAREYEIPAVLGTKIGTSILKDGEIIIVNGTDGVIVKKDNKDN